MVQTISRANVFDKVKKVEKDGFEHWSARGLMVLLGYTRWSSFLKVIEKAKDACRKSSEPVFKHFVETVNNKIHDFELTRYACYLIAQNGDVKKPQIANAQRYFVIQTLIQEDSNRINREQKRLEERSRLKSVERVLNSTIYNRGITKPFQFARFKNTHIKALYGGKNIAKLKQERNIRKSSALADFDSTVELAAKSLALAITDINIHAKDLKGPKKLQEEVKENSASIRKSLLERGLVPERLSPEENIKQIEKRIRNLKKPVYTSRIKHRQNKYHFK